MSSPVLLDVTRAVARCWQGRTPSGIDRVGEAYIRHFADSARAVVQIRGLPLVFSARTSRALFAAMRLPRADFRRRLASLWRDIPAALARPRVAPGSLYLNVTHTDFDLGAHRVWGRRMGLRTVYLLHDLIPLTHPEVTTLHKVARHKGRVDHTLRQASAILVNSQATADDLAAYARRSRVNLPPVLAAPLGVEVAPPCDPYAAEGVPFFVSLGTIEKRKNQLVLLQAWQHLIGTLGDNAPRLLLIGDLGAGAGEVRAMLASDVRLQRHVVIRNGLDDAEVQGLLAQSRGLLFPSRAEGFGLPVAEALALGVPVIASDLPALREIGQGLPTFLAPDDVQGWASMVAQFCDDAPERRRQIEQIGLFRAPLWDDHFAALDAWLPAAAASSDLANSRNPLNLAVKPASRKLESPC